MFSVVLIQFDTTKFLPDEPDLTLAFSTLIDGHRRFGFSNLAAARQGKEGSDCRGEEHEVRESSMFDFFLYL
jgi:hypothetical protein